MGVKVLKQDVLDRIKNDPILFGKVAAALSLSIRRLSDILPKNEPRLATATVLSVIRDHVGGGHEDNDFLEEKELEPIEN